MQYLRQWERVSVASRPCFWKRHSPVLFPIVGSVWENQYRNEGIAYTLSQHGFARDMEFTLVSEKEDEVRYHLVSNEETLRKFPFPFCLEIGYRIQGKQIEVIWEVKNTGEKEMYFQIGAHPAFYWPDFNADTQNRGFFGFDKEEGLKYILISEKDVQILPLNILWNLQTGYCHWIHILSIKML